MSGTGVSFVKRRFSVSLPGSVSFKLLSVVGIDVAHGRRDPVREVAAEVARENEKSPAGETCVHR